MGSLLLGCGASRRALVRVQLSAMEGGVRAAAGYGNPCVSHYVTGASLRISVPKSKGNGDKMIETGDL